MRNKRVLVVKGSVFVDGFIDCENDGKVVAWMPEGQVNLDEAIVIEGDITVKGDLLVDYELYAAKNITCMKARGE